MWVTLMSPNYVYNIHTMGKISVICIYYLKIKNETRHHLKAQVELPNRRDGPKCSDAAEGDADSRQRLQTGGPGCQIGRCPRGSHGRQTLKLLLRGGPRGQVLQGEAHWSLQGEAHLRVIRDPP